MFIPSPIAGGIYALVFGVEALLFVLLAVIVHAYQKAYERRNMTIFMVLAGVAGSGAVPITLVGLYPEMSAQACLLITGQAFFLSYCITAVEQWLKHRRDLRRRLGLSQEKYDTAKKEGYAKGRSAATD